MSDEALIEEEEVKVTNIIEPLRQFEVDLSTLTLDPENARKHDALSIEAVRHSLDRFGQRLPIIVQADGLVVRVGNARVIAARQLGWTGVAALVLDDNNIDAVAYALADNRLGELSTWDWGELTSKLESLVEADAFDGLDNLGWSIEELDAILPKGLPSKLRLTEDNDPTVADPDAPAEFPQVDIDIKTDHRCPQCGYEWSGSKTPGSSAVSDSTVEGGGS